MKQITYIVNQDMFDSYSFSESEKDSMRNATADVQSAFESLRNDPWFTCDIDHLYEALADYYPRTVEGDDREKVISANADDKYVTAVKITLWENKNGEIEATLEPANYSFNEFNENELADMGIEF